MTTCRVETRLDARPSGDRNNGPGIDTSNIYIMSILTHSASTYSLLAGMLPGRRFGGAVGVAASQPSSNVERSCSTSARGGSICWAFAVRRQRLHVRVEKVSRAKHFDLFNIAGPGDWVSSP